MQEAKRHLRLIELPELPTTFSDTSVEDPDSKEYDTRLATLEREFPQLQEEFCRPKPHLRSKWRI